MTGADTAAWLTLLRAPGVGPASGLRLVQQHGSARAALDAGVSAWRQAGIPDALHEALRSPDRTRLDADLAWLDAPGRCLLTVDDAGYPQRLLESGRPPLALFCQGDPQWLSQPQLAMVGARSATAQGLENARAFAGEMARRGLTVTSGLALGIDGAAHEGALDAGGGTVAVCGTGLDRVYPARHRRLAHRIAEQGVLVSEFPPGTAAKAENFPRRNRIISGLALGVLVVEAAARSGSLITARLAVEQGREVFAMPGSIHNPLARGCHALIREGAKLVETAADILEEMAAHVDNGLHTAPARRRVQSGNGLSSAAQATLAALDDAPVPFDTLVMRTGLGVPELSAALLDLELAGLAASMPGGAFMRLLRAS